VTAVGALLDIEITDVSLQYQICIGTGSKEKLILVETYQEKRISLWSEEERRLKDKTD